LGIPSHIVGVYAQEVPETMRHEHGPEPRLHHLVDVSLKQTQLDEAGKNLSLGKLVHVHPRHTCVSTTCPTWLDRLHHGPRRRPHRLVDRSLVSGELAVGREGACDVGAVAVVLPAH
ncbi:hypothetical protein EGW08_022761, partial [Elysia chlorotica]